MSTSLFPQVVPKIDANPERRRLNLYMQALLLPCCPPCWNKHSATSSSRRTRHIVHVVSCRDKPSGIWAYTKEMVTIFWQLSIRLEVASFVRVVLENHVGFCVLVVAEANQNDVASVDPHLAYYKKQWVWVNERVSAYFFSFDTLVFECSIHAWHHHTSDSVPSIYNLTVLHNISFFGSRAQSRRH